VCALRKKIVKMLALTGLEVVALVEYVDERKFLDIQLFEDLFHDTEMFFSVRVACVDDVQKDVCVNRFGKCRGERLDKFGGQISDEPDGVGNQNGGLFVWKVEVARACVERGEQLVGDVFLASREGIEKRCLAGVCVSDERDGFESLSFSVFALLVSHAFCAFQLRFDRTLAFAQVAFHDFRVGFSNPACSDPTSLTREFFST